MCRLIVNADDYGLSSKFNDGIIDLIKEGIVTSTTVMVRREFVEVEKLKMNAKRYNVSVGIHLELESDSSFTEIKNQIEEFRKKFNAYPSHIDGHQHCHLRGMNILKIINIAKEYNLPVRSVCDQKSRELLRKCEVNTPDEYIVWKPKEKLEMYKKLLSLKNDLVAELPCHVGYYDPKNFYPYNKKREDELKILRSKEFKKNCLAKVKLTNYSQLAWKI